ncbi:MAG: hypothetical protein GF390_00705 [Candidatus Pacebacteria bacterium]|nr:hypothetical protein [Candidatus Paceibacterota bacterium]
MLAQLKNNLLDLVLPKFCVQCQRWNCFLCDDCLNQIDFFSLPVQLQLKPNYLDQSWAMGRYQPPLSSLIQAYKYQQIKKIGLFLAKLLWFYLADVITAPLITTVPLHSDRLKERGFNQAAVMGQELARLTQTDYQELLVRTYYTQPQAQIRDRAKRLQHLQNVFLLMPGIKSNQLLDQTVLILDDVITTGTTLNECAKVLKQTGVTRVISVAVCHEG